MSETIILAAALTLGVLLGAIFFSGLWWTVRKGMTAKSPALWFLGSSLLRMGIVLVGFYFVARGDWKKLLLCLLGFLIARVVVLRLTRSSKETNHAP
jgi:F1F0 ATPase subunit 2